MTLGEHLRYNPALRDLAQARMASLIWTSEILATDALC